jgi:hypothetical protein
MKRKNQGEKRNEIKSFNHSIGRKEGEVMAKKIKDCEKMTEGQLLRELVRRFVSYDKARDRYVSFIHKKLAKAGVKYELLPGWERLLMDQDEKYCLCREICRIVRKNQNFMWN